MAIFAGNVLDPMNGNGLDISAGSTDDLAADTYAASGGAVDGIEAASNGGSGLPSGGGGVNIGICGGGGTCPPGSDGGAQSIQCASGYVASYDDPTATWSCIPLGSPGGTAPGGTAPPAGGGGAPGGTAPGTGGGGTGSGTAGFCAWFAQLFSFDLCAWFTKLWASIKAALGDLAYALVAVIVLFIAAKVFGTYRGAERRG
jgi:hypothetical protein